MANIYERNYKALIRVLKAGWPDMDPTGLLSGRSYTYRPRSPGTMDLVVEKLGSTRDGGFELSLAHYFEQNGDLCQDPEMLLEVHTGQRTVEALFFQQAIPPTFQEVYVVNSQGAKTHVRVGLKRQLNSFLATWLRNLHHQGHALAAPDEDSPNCPPEAAEALVG